MAAVYLRITADFMLIDSKIREDGQKSVVEQFQEDGFDEFTLALINQHYDGPSITFDLKKSESLSGSFEVVEAGNELKIKIDSVFKISPKSQYHDAVLDPETKWVLFGIQTIYPWDIDGLVSEAYLVKNRFQGDYEALRYYLDVKVAQKKKDL